ncbi:MAG TPA: lipid A export permease/ATP-binding protein MsbA [Pseudomonadota bacterium]|mgnify:CR=1 FL=1|nr:lipid A export permease/ATP-binding protein MsbA [Xanthomonadales bacterium]MBP7418216.1 lipid A export permease/ATP-binding protein MsbA [Xanthomonadales bacterium]HQW64646.1 lipid A export permease/ATP-binding protein MsbA [Pseudomonadota bacterium]HQX24399.1 lipid A export permease/ATP-binding protein MsbA [Pseudomonadota bacterium]HQY36669.1 lipid A export permease/ATP-binding protein MsbA [Pseudomonadota bacterium]
MATTNSSAPTSGTVYRRLLGYAARQWPLLVLAFIGMGVEAAAAGGFTWLMKPMVDETFVARNQSVSVWLPLAIVGLFVVRGIATFATDYGMARVGRTVVRTLREDTLAKYLRLPSAWFDREPPAAMVTRLTYHTEQVAQASSDAIKVIVTDLLTLVALFTVMLLQSVKVTLTLVVTVPLIAVIIYTVGRRYRRISAGIQGSVSEMSQVAEQAISGQQVVKIAGAQAMEQRRLAEIAARNYRLNVKVETTKAMSSSLVQLLSAIALAVILYVAGLEAMRDRLSAGQFVSLMSAMLAMLPSLKRITNVQSMIQKGVAAAGSLFHVLDAPAEADLGTHPLQRARGEVEFREVSVRYADDKAPALDRVSLRCEPGTVTAIVGRSGGGKSTLVRLLPRFYEASAGAVLLDGVPVADYRLADLRRQIAWVGQDVVLFDDSIAHNIAYGTLETATPAQIEAAAEAAHAMEFIRRMPQGLETRIGDNGAMLSGGQRQRLAIARAILKDAPILVLDEATSSLDAESERLIQDALERIMRARTTLVIAHRLSTVEHADRVVVLDAGRVVEQGTHAELLARGGQYAHLHRLHFRDPEPS